MEKSRSSDNAFRAMPFINELTEDSDDCQIREKRKYAVDCLGQSINSLFLS